MATKLYDTITQKIIYTTEKDFYTIDGVRPILPYHIIELVIIDTPPPPYDQQTQHLMQSWYIDLINFEYKKTWVIQNKTQYEIAIEEWKYVQYTKRIIAPADLIFNDIGIKMYGWFKLNDLPVELIGDYIYLWCNEILPEHQTIVDSLNGIIVIEDKPLENNI